MKVVSTERSQVLAARLAECLHVPIAPVKYTRFPDGEQYLEAGPLDDQMVILGSTTSDAAFVQLLLLLDACEGCDNTLILPYMGYARQDKKFKPGEPLSARAVGRALSTGVSSVITVNIHEPAIFEYFKGNPHNVCLSKEVALYISESGLNNPLVLAPDKGASRFAGEVAKKGGWGSDYLEKTRHSGESVTMEPKSMEVKGRDVVIVDDIISTGGTLVTATSMLYSQGARSIQAVCVHGVLIGGAYSRMRSAGIRNVSSSDTIESVTTRFSAVASLADVLKK